MALLKALQYAALTATMLVAQTGFARADTRPIAISTLAPIKQFFLMTPQQLYEKFGRPAAVLEDSLCCRIGTYTGPILVHIFDLENGGRIGFLFEQPWRIHGIVYDLLNSAEPVQLRAFFTGGDPRETRLWSCLGLAFYHTREDETTQGWPATQSALIRWTGANGSDFFARYRTAGHLATKYDPVTGQDVPTLGNIDSLELLQFGYFLAPTYVGDFHLTTNEDFTTLTPNMRCTRYQ